MSDAFHYFRAHAVRALCKARAMPLGRMRHLQIVIGSPPDEGGRIRPEPTSHGRLSGGTKAREIARLMGFAITPPVNSRLHRDWQIRQSKQGAAKNCRRGGKTDGPTGGELRGGR
jgi:hypothetical protein